MALNRRKSVFVMMAVALLAVVLGVAWHDGGQRPLTAQSAPAVLPGAAQ